MPRDFFLDLEIAKSAGMLAERWMGAAGEVDESEGGGGGGGGSDGFIPTATEEEDEEEEAAAAEA